MIIRIHRITINRRENGCFINICDKIIAMYHICGHGIHGKIDQMIAIIHRIIHITQQIISILTIIVNINFCVGKKCINSR